ncbi:hypothetical protein E5676_scaffold425G00080 [Cucumis melo var. makuwa]|uniref:Uncharacterized protein n=1 Tax=Cucumis melo var. makuwa TaxID=1194695 RepID=A0A5D3DQX6_CUCMM|nr:hypothetical protein E5676_scaffold425G00080 [Cucumis melo var. makuwa]
MHGGKWYLSLPVGLQPESLRLENVLIQGAEGMHVVDLMWWILCGGSSNEYL